MNQVPTSLKRLSSTSSRLRAVILAILPLSHPPIPPEIEQLLSVIVVCLRKLQLTTPEEWRTAIFGEFKPSFEYETGHQDLIEKQIEGVMKRDRASGIQWKDQNLLTRGFEMRRFNDESATMNNDNLHQKAHNAMVDQLMAKPWELFHKWCGDAVLIWLLTRTLLFQEIPNGCWLQLTGRPLHCLINKNNNNSATGYKTSSTACLLPRSRIFYVRSRSGVVGLTRRHFAKTALAEPTSKKTARRIALHVLRPRELEVQTRRVQEQGQQGQLQLTRV